MAHTFKREALYEEVWSTPLTTLGPRYNLSDNGLRKICRAMNIPLPPAGHWAKVAAGKPVRKIALPAKTERTTFFSDPPLPTAREHVDPDDQTWLKERLAFEAAPQHHIIVPASTEVWHKAIEPLRGALHESILQREREIEARDKATEKREKLAARGVWEPNFDYLKYRHLDSDTLRHPRLAGCLQVTEATGARALSLVNALFLACEARGFSVGFGEKGSGFRLSLPKATFHLMVRERQAGELAFNVSRDALSDFTVAGNAGDRLEDQLNRFLCRLYRSVVSARERAKERKAEEEQQRLRAIAAEARRELMAIEAAERAAEKAKREDLLTEVTNWQRAQRIRDYVRAIADEPIDGPRSQHERGRWCAWALDVADDICPVAAKLKSFDVKA